MTRSETGRHVHADSISLRQVRYFVQVARSGSLTAASLALGVSQPAIGQQLRLLEENVGVPLFLRHSRGVQLSAEGRAWLPAAQKILESVNDAVAIAGDLAPSSDTVLRLGVTPSIARAILPPLLEGSAQGGAPHRLDFVEGLSEDLESLIADGKLDVAFSYRPGERVSIVSEPIAEEALCVIGPVSQIGEGLAPFPLDRMAEIPLILGRRPNRIRDMLDAALGAIGQKTRPVLELDLAGLKRDFLIGRDYCTVSPRGLFLSDIREGRLAGRPIEATETRRNLYLLARADLSAQAFRWLRAAIDEVLATHVPHADLCWVDHATQSPR